MATPVKTVRPYQRPGFWARLTSGNPTEAQLGYLLLIPAFLVLALVMFYPILNVVWKSLHYESSTCPRAARRLRDWRTSVKWSGAKGSAVSVTHLLVWRSLLLAGLVALWALVWRRFSWTALGLSVLIAAVWALLGIHPGPEGSWNDPRFYNAFGVSLLIICVTVLGSFLVGLPLALVADLKTRWRWLVRVALLLPWAMPPVLTGLMFACCFKTVTAWSTTS